MRDKRTVGIPLVGVSSLLTIFAVLCLTVFTLLSVATVQANGRVGESVRQAVADYYEADSAAHGILAEIRAGEIPDAVEEDNGVYRFSCPISQTQRLCVEVAVTGTEYTVLRWQAQSADLWQNDDKMPVWDGEKEG
ncbi:MAG: hypothetical protein IJB75_00260 [Oscillospiraceae bacterium]|nr:hypothetical protein [Oscillospiraceae bacterium]